MKFDPSSIRGAIIWGVIAGLRTSVVLFVLGLFFTKIALPWYEALIFKGVDLRGIWLYEFEERGARYSVQMSFEQHAHRISGSASLSKSGAGQQGYVQLFTVDGRLGKGSSFLINGNPG